METSQHAAEGTTEEIGNSWQRKLPRERCEFRTLLSGPHKTEPFSAAPLSWKRCEVAVNLESLRLALLGMELGREDAPPSDGRGEPTAVIAVGQDQ